MARTSFRWMKSENRRSKPPRPGRRNCTSWGDCIPGCKFDYYLDMLRAIRDVAPQLHIKAFTAVEFVHFVKVAGRGAMGMKASKAFCAI